MSYHSSIHLYMSLISLFVVLYCNGPMGRHLDGYMGSRSHFLLVGVLICVLRINLLTVPHGLVSGPVFTMAGGVDAS